MSRIKLRYNMRDGRIELLAGGSSGIPMATLDSEEFADFLYQVNNFVHDNTPVLNRKKSRVRAAFEASIRRDAWKWIGGAIREKIIGKKKDSSS